MADLYNNEDVVPPRTDAETDSSVDAQIQKGISRYARRNVAGFMILVAALAFSLGSTSRTGCEGRQNTAKVVSGLIMRLDNANKQNFEKGKITEADREDAHTLYVSLANTLTVPSCHTLF